MKSVFKFFLLLTLILSISEGAMSQRLLDRVKNKANKKLEERLEKKLDKEMDKQLDKLENSIDSLAADGTEDAASPGTSSLENRMSSMMKGMGMSGEPVVVEDSYAFTELVQMHIESFDKSNNKTSNSEFITHLNPESQSLAYEVLSTDAGNNEQGLFIIDVKNKAIILLNDKPDKKTGVVYGMGTFFEGVDIDEETYDDEEMPDNVFANPKVKKTGKTKDIAGYKCEQYTYNDEETDSEFWITDELKTSTTDFFSTLFKTSAYTNGMGHGYVMESFSRDKNTGDTNTLIVTKVDKKSNKHFDLSSYQVTNLGTFNIPAGADK